MTTIDTESTTTESKPPTTEVKRRVRGPRIGPRSAGMRMTVDEFDALSRSRWLKGYRYEVIREVLVVSPSVSIGEGGPNDILGHLLWSYQEASPQGKALNLTASERTVPGTPNRRRCNRAVWVGLGRVPDVDQDIPAIVIEFVSARKRDALRDYEEKRDEYLAADVKEYWIIDRFRRIMTVYRKGLMGPTYEIVTEAQTFQTGLLPGFALPLSRLLATADELTRARQERRGSKTNPTPPSGGTDG
jgi:Uma2 family endonuclease